MKKKDKFKIALIDYTTFAILWLLYTVFTCYLFYNQACSTNDIFDSDTKVYILEMQGIENGHLFAYPIFFKLGAFFNLFFEPQIAITIALIVLNSLSVIILKFVILKFCVFDKKVDTTVKYQIFVKILMNFVTVSLFIVSMLFLISGEKLPGIGTRYTGVFSPNPFHNATYLAARPFSIICFFMFVSILDNYEKRFSWKKSIVFGLFLLLSTMTKPSFTFVLVPTAGAIMLYRLIKCRFSNFKHTFFLGICFLPTFADLIYQFFGMFGSQNEMLEAQIGIGFLTAWKYYCGNVILAVILALAFPLVVFCFHHKEAKINGMYRLTIQYCIVSIFMTVFLYEKGFRSVHMNFAWGYMYGMFFSFVGAAIVLLRSTFHKTKSNYILVFEWMIFFSHLVCGVVYFKDMLLGGTFR